MSQRTTSEYLCIQSRLANSIAFNNENILRGQQQQQPPPPAIINIESDDSDHDVTFLETVQKSSVPTLQSQPPVPRPTRPPECLVKTRSGPLDYHENCLCVKCRKMKACLAKWDDECDCEDCQPDCTGAGGQRQQKQQPKATNPSVHQHSRVPPQRSHHNNPQQQQPKVLPPNDDDNRNSKCSTPYYMSQFFGNEDFNDHAEGDHSDGDEEETNQTEPTSSSTTNKQKMMMKNNKKASTSPSQCPRCQVIISSTARMATHYRVMHLAWRPYYCKWTKCAFTSGHSILVRNHIKSKHLNTTETSALKHVKQYVGKRAEDDPNDELLPTDGLLSEHLLASTGTHWPVTRSTSGPTTFECPKCGRKFAYQLYLDAHLVSHGHSGVRCTWANNCGHFYSSSKLKDAKQHVCTDHLGISAVDITRKDRKDAKKHLEYVTSGNDNFSFVASSSYSSATAKLTTSIVPASQNNGSNDNEEDADQQPTAEPINMPQFNCPQCPTSCRTMARLIEHLLLMHTTKKKPFVCFRCTYSSYCEASVAEHYHTVHNGTNLFWCKLPNCANAYFALEQIEAHLRAKHASALAGMDISGREWNKVIDMFVLKRYLAVE